MKWSEPLQWGRSNLVDPAECSKIGLLNRNFGSFLSVVPRKKSKTQSSLILQSGPQKSTVGTKTIPNREQGFLAFISEHLKLQPLLQDRPCLELVIAASNF